MHPVGGYGKIGMGWFLAALSFLFLFPGKEARPNVWTCVQPPCATFLLHPPPGHLPRNQER